MNFIKRLLGAPFEIAGAAYANHVERKIKEAELEDAKHARRLEVIREGRANEATWNLKSIENSGWKDEYLTIVLSLPLILAFVGPLQGHIADGFEAIQAMPLWYKSAVGVMVSSAFGYQKFNHNRMTKAYSLPSKEK